MKRLVLLPILGFALSAAAEARSFDTPVHDVALADMRGGFTLPNGMEVNISVVTSTMVNGAVVLRSVFSLDDTASLRVYVGDQGPQSGVVPTREGATSDGSPGHEVSYDPQNGLTLMPTSTRLNVSVGSSARGAMTDPGEGLDEIDIGPGRSVATPGGTVSLAMDPRRSEVRLQGDRLATSHFYGDTVGSLTINSGSDRAIDTTSSISLDLANVSPDVIGSVLLRTEGMALDATGMLVR